MTSADKSFDRAEDMVDDPSIPIDLNGLYSFDRAKVMVYRPDCPIDLTGLDSSDRAWVLENRPDYTQTIEQNSQPEKGTP